MVKGYRNADDSFRKFLGKTVLVSFASTFGTITGLIAAGYAVERIQKARKESRNDI